MADIDKSISAIPGGFFNPLMMASGSSTGLLPSGSSAVEGPFETDGEEVRNCVMTYGRRTVKCNDTRISVGSGDVYVYAQVSHENGKLTMSVKTGSEVPDPSLTVTCRPIYLFSDGSMVADFRNMPMMLAAD